MNNTDTEQNPPDPPERKKKPGPKTAHANTARRLQTEQRRKIVAANILGGLTYREIAPALDVSLGTIAADLRAILAEWRKHYVRDADRWVNIQLRRLDVLLNAVWDKAKGGDVAAIECALRIMERQSRLLGLDAPTQHKVTVVPVTADDLAQARDEVEKWEREQLGLFSDN